MEEKRPTNTRPPRRDLDPAAVERRRAALKARRKRQMRLRMAVVAGMAVIAILVVVLVVMAISALFKKDGKTSKDATPTPAPTMEAQTPEPSPTPDTPYLQETINNTKVENLSSLPTDSLPCGYGPSRDEQNRPIDMVRYQEKYEQYGACFVNSHSDDKVIYLTSDEGYEYGFTPAILDALKETDTQIVFFVTLDFAKQHPDYVQRMIDEGHIVGNHSATHPSAGLPSQDLATQEEEVLEVHRYVKENFNYDMWLFRYPTGAFSEQSLALLNNLNYRTVFWSFAYNDWNVDNQPDPQEALQKCLDSLHPGAVYLLHAVSETNATIMKDFINGAKERGYRFELIPAAGFAAE